MRYISCPAYRYGLNRLYLLAIFLFLCLTVPARAETAALNLDGQGDYINLGNKGTLSNIIGPLTLEAWIRPTGWGQPDSLLFDKGNFLLFLNSTGTDYNDHSLVFYLHEPASYQSASMTPANSVHLNIWQHVAVSYNSAGDVKICINGVSQEITRPFNPPKGPVSDNKWAPFYLGNTILSGDRGFQGQMRDVRVWNTVRKPEQIQAAMNTALSVSESGLIGYWPVDEYGSTTLEDNSGNGNTATINGATWTVVNPVNDSDGDGVPDDSDGCPDDPAKTAPGICGCRTADSDTDGDATPDCKDGCPDDPAKTTPSVCGCNVVDIDTDNDGTPDCKDICPNDPAKTVPGYCGCGEVETDSDGDGKPDCCDACPEHSIKLLPGVCGCDTPDTDTDSDGIPDCLDECPDNPEKTAPGICGCRKADTDTDGDGMPDCRDLCPESAEKTAPGLCGCSTPDADRDGDGTPDCNDQCPDDATKVTANLCGCGDSDLDTDGDGTPDCNDACPAWPERVMPGVCGCAPGQDRNFALRFDGSGGYADFGKDASLDIKGPLTLEAWIRPAGWQAADSGGAGRIFDKGNFTLFLNKTGSGYNERSLVFYITHEDASETSHATPAGSIAPGNWYHVAVTYDGQNRVRMYINGQSQPLTEPAGPGSGPVRSHSWASLFMGNSLDLTRPFEGDISNARVWHVVRTGDHIHETMNTGLSGLETGLAAYWPMCTKGADVLADISGNGNNGIIHDAVWTDGPNTDNSQEKDTDGDGVPDAQDRCPADPGKSLPGLCGCSVADTDSDGDGTPDCRDGCPSDSARTSPGYCGCGVADTDSDGDGVPDCADDCPDSPIKSAPGYCGCDVPDTDRDGDGVPDCVDGCPDSAIKSARGVCGCDAPDVDEDGDGMPDCADACPDDPAKDEPGVCGCGVPDADTDGDGLLDCEEECPEAADKTGPDHCGCISGQTENSSVRFTSGAYVNLGNDPSLNLTGPMTLEAWIRPSGWGENTPSGFGRIFDKSLFQVFLNNTGSEYAERSLVFFMIHADNSRTAWNTATDTVALNRWQHVAISYDGISEALVYVNGEKLLPEKVFNLSEGPVMDNTSYPLYIGNSGASEFTSTFEGRISDIRVWRTVRTADQVRSDMENGLSGIEEGLAGYWPMCGDEILKDYSGNGNNGIFAGTEQGTGPYNTVDTDGDGTPDDADGCPLDPEKTAEGLCGCGVSDTDSDGDGIPDCNDGNHAPEKPQLLLPLNTLPEQPLVLQLQTRAFSDVDDGDTHARTLWEISTASDFSEPVFSAETAVYLTQLTVPHLVLEGKTLYYWRVRFYDRTGEASPWSDAYSFTTRAAVADADGDAVPDVQEADAGVDLNHDNTMDSKESGMFSLNSGTGMTGFKSSTGVLSLTRAEAFDPAEIADTQGRPEDLPLGLAGFRIRTTTGGLVQMLVYASETLPEDTIWYWYDTINGWRNYATYATPETGGYMVLKLKDGDIGDSDGVANGVIVHLAGPDRVSSVTPVDNGDTDDGGGGGCLLRRP